VTLLLGLIEDLAERVQKQDEEIALLKDEVRVLKGQKKRPQFKGSPARYPWYGVRRLRLRAMES